MSKILQKDKAAYLDQILGGTLSLTQVKEKITSSKIGDMPVLAFAALVSAFSGIEGLSVTQYKGNNLTIEGIVLGGNEMFKKGTFSLQINKEKDSTFNKNDLHEKLVKMAAHYESMVPKIREAAVRVQALS